GRRVLRGPSAPFVRDGGRAAPGARPGRGRGGARGARAGVAGRVRPSVRLRRRAAAQPLGVRLVLGHLPGSRRPRRVPPRRARRHARRVPQVPPRGREREHDGHEHGDGRAARRLRARPGRRQHRRHDRHAGAAAHGWRLRALPAPAVPVPRVGRRVDPHAARAHGRAGEGVPAREALAEPATERVLPPPVLGRVRARGVELGRVRGVARARPRAVGIRLPAPPVPSRGRQGAARGDRPPVRRSPAEGARRQRDRGVPAALVMADLDLARMRRDRHRKVVDVLDAEGLAAAVLLGQAAVAYAVGARAPAADAARSAHERTVAVVTADGAAPHVYTSFAEGAPPDLPADHVHPALAVEWPEGAAALADVLPEGRVALDEYTMPLHEALRGREVADATALLSACKVMKTADELECIRRAQSINEEAMQSVDALVEPGARGTELSGAFLHRIFELGATANTVDPIWQVMPPRIADGPYSATGDVVFPTPTTSRRLEAGDVVWVDTGIDYEGYASDFGCTFAVGGPQARHREQAA